MAQRFSLTGKRAVVTGGTKGIGRACAVEFLELGAAVFIVARDRDLLDKTVAEWAAKYPGRVFGQALDVSDPASREALAATVAAQWGALDILVNNVGTNIRKPTTDYTTDEYRRIMSTNLDSVFDCCRLFHGLLKAAGSATIVNIGSVAGVQSRRPLPAHGAHRAQPYAHGLGVRRHQGGAGAAHQEPRRGMEQGRHSRELVRAAPTATRRLTRSPALRLGTSTPRSPRACSASQSTWPRCWHRRPSTASAIRPKSAAWWPFCAWPRRRT